MTQSSKMRPFRLLVAQLDEDVADSAHVCRVGDHISFDAEAYDSYSTSNWDPLVYDCMLLAAAVEICDNSRPRRNMKWARQFHIDLPVHNPIHWDGETEARLVRALRTLTGDCWSFNFRLTKDPQEGPTQQKLFFPESAEAVIPYSDGLDSKAVGAIKALELKDRLIRVRIGPKKIDRPSAFVNHTPFANIPFRTKRVTSGNGEPSGRSRGFKFAILSGIAAYLTGASCIIVPESGQGAIGPVLVNLGQIYLDKRTHPQFTSQMSSFLEALFNRKITFEHPVIWRTKGESLGEYKRLRGGEDIWKSTRSCWMDARHASLNGSHRQCGICAACMLRRTSLLAAGYQENPEMYLWQDLSASKFESGSPVEHQKYLDSKRAYAIAGVLHMDHLAGLRRSADRDIILERQALVLARATGASVEAITTNLIRLLDAHSSEWSSFVQSHSSRSFLREWAKEI